MKMLSYFFLVSDCRRAVLVFLGKKVLWYFRHGTFLCAYIRGYLDGGPVCFHDAATIQDAPSGLPAPLGQRSEADGFSPGGYLPQLFREGDMVPRNPGLDVVFWIVRIRDVRNDRPGRIGYAF